MSAPVDTGGHYIYYIYTHINIYNALFTETVDIVMVLCEKSCTDTGEIWMYFQNKNIARVQNIGQHYIYTIVGMM